MAIAKGKYDDICTVARESAEAFGAIVIIVGGKHGEGVSVQVPEGFVQRLPEMLRNMATLIETDWRNSRIGAVKN